MALAFAYWLCEFEACAYEYAKRGARLALVARREDHLLVVANKARKLGSLEVIVSCADVSKFEECKRFVDEAISHFGQCKCLAFYFMLSPWVSTHPSLVKVM